MKIERLTTATLWVACGALAAANVFVACSDRTSQTRPQETVGVAVPPERPPVLPTTSTDPASTPPTTTTPPTPEEIRLAWREGLSLYDKGDYRLASDRLALAVAGRPYHPYTHYLLGLSLWKAGELDRAEREMTRASELAPRSVRTYVNLARVRLDHDDPEGALEASESALTIDPGSIRAMHQKGRALASLKRNDEALAVLASAHALDPAEGHVANTYGWLLLQMGRTQDAVPILESARVSLPGLAYVRNNLGVAYERSGRRDEAIVEYRAAIENGDTEGKAASSLARLGGPTPVDATADGTTPAVQDPTPNVETKTTDATTKAPAPSGR